MRLVPPAKPMIALGLLLVKTIDSRASEPDEGAKSTVDCACRSPAPAAFTARPLPLRVQPVVVAQFVELGEPVPLKSSWSMTARAAAPHSIPTTIATTIKVVVRIASPFLQNG